MKLKHFSLLALCALITGVSSCKDDDGWSTVDGADPVCTLQSTSVSTAEGRAINIKGKITDADGIKSILLWCPDLYMKKTIDIIDIYGEPLKEYDLDYSFTLARNKDGKKFDVEITVTDVAGKSVTEIYTVNLDGDYTAPEFIAAPSAELTVLKGETSTTLDIEFSIADNRGIDHIVINLNEYDISTKVVGAAVGGGFPLTIDVEGEESFEYSESVDLPNKEGAYLLTVEVFDNAAQEGSVRSTKSESVVTVLGSVDFPKMYLADVYTPAELNADVFGVPMRIDRTGPCQYTARYYNQKANTGVYFIPQKGSLSPICYGLDPSNPNRMINSPAKAKPLVLEKANTYYQITFNTETGAYTCKSYLVQSQMTPIFFQIGGNNLNTWMNWKDTGKDDWVGTDDAWWQEYYIGTIEEGEGKGPSVVTRFEQDKNNPNLFCWEKPVKFEAGQNVRFIIHNWHSHGWWNYTSWRVDDSQECEIFYYYGEVVKQAYLDWWLGAGVCTWKDWAQESKRREILYGGAGDKWMEPVITVTGNYMLYFDAHLGRGKLVQVK